MNRGASPWSDTTRAVCTGRLEIGETSLTGLRQIGIVARLQIQRSSLKIGQKPFRVYDTSPLLAVSQARVSPEGVIALLPDGATLVDVHHCDHPQSQHAVKNAVSIGFTTNYARMRERFGDHMIDGCAGENILIQTMEPIGLNDVGRGVAIRCAVDDAELWFQDVQIALPCIEFSRHSLRMPRAEKRSADVRDTLQFLGGGTRGYYATPSNPHRPVTISLGDRVFVLLQR